MRTQRYPDSSMFQITGLDETRHLDSPSTEESRKEDDSIHSIGMDFFEPGPSIPIHPYQKSTEVNSNSSHGGRPTRLKRPSWYKFNPIKNESKDTSKKKQVDFLQLSAERPHLHQNEEKRLRIIDNYRKKLLQEQQKDETDLLENFQSSLNLEDKI